MVTPPNIKNQIKGTIDDPSFPWGNSYYTINDFRIDVNEFFGATDYNSLDRHAGIIVRHLTAPHLKDSLVGDLSDSLNNYERDVDYSFTERRLHYSHQVYVFLIGLYIYHNCNLVISLIHEEIDRTIN